MSRVSNGNLIVLKWQKYTYDFKHKIEREREREREKREERQRQTERGNFKASYSVTRKSLKHLLQRNQMNGIK